MNSKDKIEQIDMGKNEVNDDDDDGSKGGSVSSSSAISGHDSMTDTSGRGGGTSTGGTSASSLSLAQQETRTVRRIKFLVLAVIGLAAITCSVFTFIFVAASESKTFQAQVNTVRCLNILLVTCQRVISHCNDRSFLIMLLRLQIYRTSKRPARSNRWSA